MAGSGKLWFVSGIQQIGIGVSNVEEAFRWFRASFGMDVPIFDDAGEAPFMTAYTGGAVHSRRAILAANLHGGSALEIWQFTSRTPAAPSFEIEVGDLGILSATIKSPDVRAARAALEAGGAELIGGAAAGPGGADHFFVRGPEGALFEVSARDDWFNPSGARTGGVAGCMIGVSDIDRALGLYSGILGYGHVRYDETGRFDDLSPLPGGKRRFRRVLLNQTGPARGAFGRLFGQSSIELVQLLEGKPRKTLGGRFWGDLGFIHLCFDVSGIGSLLAVCKERGFPITADSADSFDMGEAAGHFAYIEDPDGTLIEFVETHRLPILKKLGWYLDLRKRDPAKPLPNWMIKSLGLGRVK